MIIWIEDELSKRTELIIDFGYKKDSEFTKFGGDIYIFNENKFLSPENPLYNNMEGREFTEDNLNEMSGGQLKKIDLNQFISHMNLVFDELHHILIRPSLNRHLTIEDNLEINYHPVGCNLGWFQFKTY